MTGETIPPYRITNKTGAIAVVAILLGLCACGGDSAPEKGAARSGFTIESTHLGEPRDVWVYLPPGYVDSTKTYPVLYVLDAEWVFDFTVGSVALLSGEMAAKIPEAIVIGIPNTDRERDFAVNFDTTAAFMNFLRFVEHELIPRVDAVYRTEPHRTIYGWSSASNICLWMFLTKPHVFDKYIAAGTGVSPRVAEFAREEFAKHDYSGKRFFAGTEGDSPRREALLLLSELLEQYAPDGLQWECRVMAHDDHGTVLGTGLFAGLEFVFGTGAGDE